MSGKAGDNRIDIAGILYALRASIGRVWTTIILIVAILAAILVAGYSVYTFASRQSYSDLARNYMTLAEINTLQLDNLKKMLDLRERLEEKLADLKDQIAESDREAGPVRPPLNRP